MFVALAVSWFMNFRIVYINDLSSVCMSEHAECTLAVQEGKQLLENLLRGRKQEEKLESQMEWSWRTSCLEFGCAEEENK